MKDRPLKRTLKYILYPALAILWLIPILWMIDTAFKPTPEIFVRPPRWIPSYLTLEHVRGVLTKWPFVKWVWNSLVVASSATLISLVVSTLAGFSFARLRWRGRDLLFIIFLTSMLIPWEVNVVPLYFIMNRFKLLNTRPGVFLPFVAMPIGIFLLRQFFINIPVELEDAARIDGCGSLGVLWHVILPVSRPALVALGIYMFIFSWNEFLWSLISLQSPDRLTLPIGLKLIRGIYDIDYGLFMAGSFLASLPALLIFLVLQRRIIKGLAMTGGIRG